MGFADGILEDAKRVHTENVVFAFSRRAVTNSLMNKLISQSAPKPEQKKQDAPVGVSIEAAMQKLQARKYI
jgi:ATP-dependent Clp protease protease subunit